MWPSSCFNMQALYQIPIGNNFYLEMGSRLSSDHMYILDKIFIHVNNEIYTGVINLCVGDRRSRYNNCYRLSFSDNNKLAIKKIVTMSLCCQRAQSSHGKMLLSTCDGETVYSNQAKTPQYNSNSMKKHVYQDFQRRKLNISFSK